MKKFHIVLALLIATSFLSGACSFLEPRRTEWTAGQLRLSVDGSGRVIQLVDASTGRDYRAEAVPSPLLSLMIDGVPLVGCAAPPDLVDE